MRMQPTDDNPRKVALYTTPETYSAEQLWRMLLGYDRSSALLAASISSRRLGLGLGLGLANPKPNPNPS